MGDISITPEDKKLAVFSTRPGVVIDCQVHLPEFEGPLDLLLHLIKNHEIDILNLPVAAITDQYLAYLNYMREMNLDLASEYLVMAATLTYIKSHMLLPKDPLAADTGPDPRAQLIRRLVELKNYKELSLDLSRRPRLFRDVFPCRNTGAEEIIDSLDPEVALTNPFQMLEAYYGLIERRKTVTHNVVTDRIPITECVSKIVTRLKVDEHVTFQQLLPETVESHEMISMFLGILELTRLQFTTFEQPHIFGPIDISRKVAPEQMDDANLRIRGQGSWE